jgi:hypothetical protein
MDAFVAALRGDRDGVRTSARESLQSHLLAFAAERSRTNGGEPIHLERAQGAVL